MTRIDKMIIDFIVDYYKENMFYPSYDEIAEGIGRAKATVHTHMRKLEEEGLIIRKADCSPQYRLINMRFLFMDQRRSLCGYLWPVKSPKLSQRNRKSDIDGGILKMIGKTEAVRILQKHIDEYRHQATDNGWFQIVQKGIAEDTIQARIGFQEEAKMQIQAYEMAIKALENSGEDWTDKCYLGSPCPYQRQG